MVYRPNFMYTVPTPFKTTQDSHDCDSYSRAALSLFVSLPLSLSPYIFLSLCPAVLQSEMPGDAGTPWPTRTQRTESEYSDLHVYALFGLFFFLFFGVALDWTGIVCISIKCICITPHAHDSELQHYQHWVTDPLLVWFDRAPKVTKVVPGQKVTEVGRWVTFQNHYLP